MDHEYLDFDDVLIEPKIMRHDINSRSEVELTTRISRHLNGSVPIIASNMDGVGTMEMGKALHKFDMMTALTKFHEVEDLNEFNHYNDQIWISTGISDKDFERLMRIVDKYSVFLVNIDIANGYLPALPKFIEKVKNAIGDKYGHDETVIMAGNVATPSGVAALVSAGANIVKIGIGPGSVCTTRLMTGVGVPQISAIQSCAKTAAIYDAMICADGGCKTPGDIVKAFVAGADMVMLGGMLAGHQQGGATVDNYTTKFYGSASKEAIDKHHEDKVSYISEGKSVEIPFRGDVSHTANRILAGIRSAMTYTNCQTITDLKKCRLIKVRHQYNDVFGKSEL